MKDVDSAVGVAGLVAFLGIYAGLSVIVQGETQKPAIAVVTLTDVEAYTRALQGLREEFPNMQVWDARDEARLRENLSNSSPVVVIGVGSSAAAALERVAPPHLALVSSVVLQRDVGMETDRPHRFRTVVTVDLPSEVLLDEIGRLFPGKSRIGVIRGPMQTDAYMKAFEQAARGVGLTVEVLACQQAKDLLEIFLQFKSRVDLVWCPPNGQLYNSATVKPLLMASLTNRLPIIGYSEQFVQAGALIGGFADFVDVGHQTAALALRVARNEPVPPSQGARKFRFAYNQRVARMLGIKAIISDRTSRELVVIQ